MVEMLDKTFNYSTAKLFNQYASLVQLVERRSPKPDVEGSSPSGRELYKGNTNG